MPSIMFHEYRVYSIRRHLNVVFTAVLCSLLASCIGATRVPTRARVAEGEEKKLDFSFLQVGVTCREDVDARLGWLNAGYSNPRLFWGRWANSSWGYWAVVAGPPGNAAGTGGRMWGIKNVLLEFDSNSLLQRQTLFEDKQLLRVFHNTLASEPALDLSKPATISVEHWHRTRSEYMPAQLHLGREELAFYDDWLPAHKFRVSPGKIARIDTAGRMSRGGVTERPELIPLALYLSEDTKIGNKLRFRTDAASLIKLLQYLKQAGPQTIRWE